MMENKLLDNELLIQYKTDLESLELWKSVKDIDKSDKRSEQYCMKLTSLKIEKCFEALEQGLSITAQLEDIKDETENYWYNEQSAKPILDILRQFKFENYQEELYHFIKQNTNWHNKERDFGIYQEIQKGTLYSEIAERMVCDISNISKINKKVQSSINNLKGRFFEIEYEKYLKNLDKFQNCKIVRDGNPGKPDIYISDNIKKGLYVFSLKNLEINKKSYCITTEQLKPELKFAYNNSISKKFNSIFLLLIVFDSFTEKLKAIEINYQNPNNITITH